MESVDEIASLSDDLALLLSTGKFTDVTFLVEGEEVLGHRMLLAARSEYFRKLLFGDFVEAQQTRIELVVKLKPFKLILSYIYTGRVELKQLDEEQFMDLLGLVHLYEMEKLQSAVVKILQGKLSLETCYWLYNAAVKYDLDELLKSCQIFLDKKAGTFVKHQSFNMLTEPALKLLLKRDSFYDFGIDIFMAAKAWCEQFPKIDPKSILADVQYSLISIKDLVQKVKPTGLVDYEVLLKAIEAKFEEPCSPLEHSPLTCRIISPANYDMTKDYTALKIKFYYTYNICCINSIYTPSTSVKFSTDNINWKNIHDGIAERNETRIRFKNPILVRYLCIYSCKNFSGTISGVRLRDDY